MSQVPWNFIIPGLVEIAKEIIGLFKSRKENPARRRQALKFIKRRFPDLKESEANLVIELVVYAHKQGMTDETKIAKFVEGILGYLPLLLGAVQKNRHPSQKVLE
jgi:hypothetical protein